MEDLRANDVRNWKAAEKDPNDCGKICGKAGSTQPTPTPMKMVKLHVIQYIIHISAYNCFPFDISKK